MFFWFAGLSLVGVALVFASPAIDYRLVMLGAVLPVAELLIGGPWPLHTLLAPVLAMTATMLVFRGKRLQQRKWLGLTIGLFLHLVLDGTWANRRLFWWPFFGTDLEGNVPSLPNPAVVVGMEVVGLIALAWAARRYQLDSKPGRELFAKTGRIAREAMGPPPGTC